MKLYETNKLTSNLDPISKEKKMYFNKLSQKKSESLIIALTQQLVILSE